MSSNCAYHGSKFMLFLSGLITKISNLCRLKASDAYSLLISGWCVLDKSYKFTGETIIFLKGVFHFVGQSLTVFMCYDLIFACKLCNYLGTAVFFHPIVKKIELFMVSPHRKLSVSKSVKTVCQIAGISRSQGHTIEQILYLASVFESTISELSLFQISASPMHF